MKEWKVIVEKATNNVEYSLTGKFIKTGFLTEYGAKRVAKKKQQQFNNDIFKFSIQRPDGSSYPL